MIFQGRRNESFSKFCQKAARAKLHGPLFSMLPFVGYRINTISAPYLADATRPNCPPAPNTAPPERFCAESYTPACPARWYLLRPRAGPRRVSAAEFPRSARPRRQPFAKQSRISERIRVMTKMSSGTSPFPRQWGQGLTRYESTSHPTRLRVNCVRQSSLIGKT